MLIQKAFSRSIVHTNYYEPESHGASDMTLEAWKLQWAALFFAHPEYHIILRLRSEEGYWWRVSSDTMNHCSPLLRKSWTWERWIDMFRCWWMWQLLVLDMHLLPFTQQMQDSRIFIVTRFSCWKNVLRVKGSHVSRQLWYDMSWTGSSVGPIYNLLNICCQFWLTNTISSPTRVTASTKTLLDVTHFSPLRLCWAAPRR